MANGVQYADLDAVESFAQIDCRLHPKQMQLAWQTQGVPTDHIRHHATERARVVVDDVHWQLIVGA